MTARLRFDYQGRVLRLTIAGKSRMNGVGAKLACPDKLCINVWGDAAVGVTHRASAAGDPSLRSG